MRRYTTLVCTRRVSKTSEWRRLFILPSSPKNEDEGWFPDNIVPVISWTPEGESEPVAVPITPEAKEQLQVKIAEARENGQESFVLKSFEKPIPVSEAEFILETFNNVYDAARQGTLDPTKPRSEIATRPRKHLVLKANIQSIDYEEARRDILRNGPELPSLPAGFRQGVTLMDHQLSGVAWLQHLFSNAPHHCRGAVLADDMGLGKTLQLLTLLAWAFETEPSLPPALIVAPVSLLENWEEETAKFLKPGALSLLTAYGDSLSALRVQRESIDAQLRSDGLVKFLKPGWRGGANVVLTTYETLRDLEFSFAAEKWSVMICDEAQRIKNPNAMVTRAAKKQNVTFRVACTGTPVENTLVDLWCLFDYVQPGLLGALNDFGRRYRRPIEAETEEERARVKELRERISPQILRRAKAEVAKNLPPKRHVPSRVPLSSYQRSLYAHAINLFKSRDRSDGVSPFKNHLGLLHYLRLICTDPRPIGLTLFRPEPRDNYQNQAPKLAWLLAILEQIMAVGEKAIIFCEFREIQRMLRHYIEEVFGFAPDIINGDTAAAAKHIASRQKRIKAFQAKSGFGVIILSPVAVGFGMNIQEANHVIHYTRSWNPAKEDQATDRAYRIGQTKKVNVYCPVVYAQDFTTFDVKLDELLSAKRELASDMLNGAGEVNPGDFAIEDVIPDASDGIFSAPITLTDALQMDWDYFECLIAAIWQKRGYRTVYRTPQHDDGVDVVAITGSAGVLLQCKTCGTDETSLGWDAVKEVVAGEAAYRMRHPGVGFHKVCVTNRFFNSTAEKHAELNNVELLGQVHLAKMLEEFPITMLDIEKLLYAEWERPS
jgi:superfamily II DNA or RNA helicase